MKSYVLAALGLAALASTAVQAQENYEIWHYYSAGSELAGMDALIETGNAAVDDANFSGVVIPGNVVELRRQLQTAFLGGRPPAAYQSSMAYELKTFADGGQLHPLTDVWAKIDGDKIFPEGVQRVVKVDGVPYGVPFDLSLINNVFYNKEAFEKAGVAIPTDWDSELGFDSPEFSEALDVYRDRMVSCYAQNWSGKTWTQTADDLINGNTGMFMMGIWAAGYMDTTGFKAGEGFDMFQAPGTVGKSIFQMDVLAVPEGPAVAAADEFIEAVTTPEGQAAFATLKGSLAPNINVDPSVYGYAGATFARQFSEASANNAVLPNLFFLLPTDLGTEFGVQIERFAIDPSDSVKAELIATLEGLRQEALAEDAFIQW